MHALTKKHIIHSIISLVIILIFWVAPPLAPMTDTGMKILGILIAVIYGIVAMQDAAFPAIGGMFFLALTGYTTAQDAIVSACGNFVVPMLLGLLVVGGIMQQTGLARILAQKIASAKWANGHPWRLTFLLLMACLIPSLFITPMPVEIVLWAVVINIAESVGFKKTDKWPAMMIIGIAGLSGLITTAMPFSMVWATNLGVYAAAGGDPTYNVGAYVITSLILCVGLALIQTLVMRFIFRPDVTPLLNYKADEAPKFEKNQKIALVLLVIFVILVLLPSFIPMGSFIGGFGTIGACFAVLFIAMALRNKDGTPFVSFQEIFSKHVFWSIIAMVAALMVLCGCLTDQSLGIAAFFTNIISPITNMGPLACYAVLILIAILGTNFLDGMVVGVVLTAVISMMSDKLAYSGIALLVMITHAGEFGILLPSASANAALAYGQCETGWVRKKDFIKQGALYMLILFILLLVIGYPTLGWFA